MENFKLLSARLKWAVERRLAANPSEKISKRLLAQHAGVSAPTVSYWFADTNGIKAEAARKLSKFLDVDPVWLEIGEGKPLMNALERVAGVMPVRAADRDDPDFIQIPMVKLRLQAGVTGFQTDPDRRDGGTLGMRRNWIQRSGYDPARLIAIQVKGESMEPSLYEDDIVVLNTADTKLVDGQVYAFNYEGEAVVKRLARDAGEWWLTSDNVDQRKYGRKVCRGDACIVIGRVVRKESDRI